jgi:hypothetical protein
MAGPAVFPRNYGVLKAARLGEEEDFLRLRVSSGSMRSDKKGEGAGEEGKFFQHDS